MLSPSSTGNGRPGGAAAGFRQILIHSVEMRLPNGLSLVNVDSPAPSQCFTFFLSPYSCGCLFKPSVWTPLNFVWLFRKICASLLLSPHQQDLHGSAFGFDHSGRRSNKRDLNQPSASTKWLHSALSLWSSLLSSFSAFPHSRLQMMKNVSSSCWPLYRHLPCVIVFMVCSFWNSMQTLHCGVFSFVPRISDSGRVRPWENTDLDQCNQILAGPEQTGSCPPPQTHSPLPPGHCLETKGYLRPHSQLMVAMRLNFAPLECRQKWWVQILLHLVRRELFPLDLLCYPSMLMDRDIPEMQLQLSRQTSALRKGEKWRKQREFLSDHNGQSFPSLTQVNGHVRGKEALVCCKLLYVVLLGLFASAA